VKLALLQVCIKLELPKASQHLCNMFSIFFQQIEEYQNVVQIHNTKAINVASHSFIDISLESGRSASQTKRHDKILVMTIMRPERCLLLVRLSDTYAVVRILEIHASVVLCSH